MNLHRSVINVLITAQNKQTVWVTKGDTMSFDISQVLDSSLAYAYNKSSGSSEQSQININARQAIRSVFNEFASQLFDDVKFMSEDGIKTLHEFQTIKLDDSEFQNKTTELGEQIEVVAHLCHSRNLQANNENRSLTDAERNEISQAFANIAAAHSSDKELSNKLAILAEAAPVVTKVSEVYVKYIRPFDQQLNLLLKEVDFPKNVKDSIDSYRGEFFPESLCTREGLKAIEEASEKPDFGQMNYEDSVRAFSNHILHLALVAKNEGRQMNDDEVEAVKDAIKALRLKMGVMRMTKINFDRVTASKDAYASTLKSLEQLPVEQKEKTRQMSEKITDMEKGLQEYNYRTKFVAEYPEFERVAKAGRKKRNKELKASKIELKDYTKLCSRKLTELQQSKEVQEKEIEKKEAEWKSFVAKKFADPSLVEHDVKVQDNMYFRIGLIMENPQLMAQTAMLFVEHLTSKVSRLPQEEQRGWLSGFRIW